MNNACPSCGAIYNVAAKDIGRRIKCKKCSTPLSVTERGLEVDQPGAPAAAMPAFAPSMEEAFVEEDGEEAVVAKKSRGRRSAGSNIDIMQLLEKIGGIPTVIFGFGAFLVIVFLFMPIIGQAAVQRAAAGVDLNKLDMENDIRDATPKDKDGNPKPPTDWPEADKKKIEEIRTKYAKLGEKAANDATAEKISNLRSTRFDRYGMMFGFLFVMAGSLAFMMPAQPPIRRVVGAVVLTAQMVLVFISFIIRGSIS